jgi:acetyl esterase/lipase
MNFTAFTFLIALSYFSTINSCNKGNKVGETKDSAVAKLDMKNVSYGSDTAQKLDVYLPAARNTTNTKVILFIHGGSWVGGDKSEFNDAIAAIHSKLPDYAIYNMNYRLLNNSASGLTDQMNDVKSALNFIDSHAEEYKINSNTICLIGASAGAHLALLEAYKNNNEGKIKAVVDLFGPTDLKDLYSNHPVPQQVRYVLTSLLGKSLASGANIYQQASPVNFVSAQTVPTCIFHGTNDIIVPIAQSNALKAKLLANNVKVEMTSYASEGHGWFGKNLSDTYSKTVQFIKENVH